MSIVVFVVGLGIAAVVILPSFRPVDLIAGLGITSIAIGFALKDVLQNFFAGILLLWQKPFRVGDQVKIKDFEGTVEDISIRSTQLLTYDGERVVLPNGDVYVSPVVVRTAYDKRRVSVKVGIKSTGDLEPAREAVRRAAAGTSGVLPQPAPEVHAESLAPGAVTLAVAYWVKPDNATVVAVNDAVLTAIKQALDAAGIALA
jgi:small conductance mechanosensitive channel